MARIDGIKYNLSGNKYYLYTKRTCSDNSELYITSKLNYLFEQASSNRNFYKSRRNLKSYVEGNHLDETI